MSCLGGDGGRTPPCDPLLFVETSGALDLHRTTNASLSGRSPSDDRRKWIKINNDQTAYLIFIEWRACFREEPRSTRDRHPIIARSWSDRSTFTRSLRDSWKLLDRSSIARQSKPDRHAIVARSKRDRGMIDVRSWPIDEGSLQQLNTRPPLEPRYNLRMRTHPQLQQHAILSLQRNLRNSLSMK